MQQVEGKVLPLEKEESNDDGGAAAASTARKTGGTKNRLGKKAEYESAVWECDRNVKCSHWMLVGR